jgi:SAM-dependent methyltransferase
MSRYGKLSSEFYALDKPDAPPDAFEFYERYACAADGSIHEPMCGTGRFLLPLLARGLDISGSDTSQEMLEACRQRARELGVEPRLTQQPLQQLSCETPPQLIFIPSGSFGLLIDDGAVKTALERAREVLAPGGLFVVEAERLLPAAPDTSGTWGGRWLERPDGAKLVFSWLTQYSGAANVTTTLHRYELVKDGQLLATELEDFRVRSYAAEEFAALLEQAGFSEIRVLKPYADVAADEEDDAFVFECRKGRH